MREQFSIFEFPDCGKFMNRYGICMDRYGNGRKQLIGTALTEKEAKLVLAWLVSVTDLDLQSTVDPKLEWKAFEQHDEDDDDDD